MLRPILRLGRTWVLLLAMVSLPGLARAEHPEHFVVFGDSLSDPGNAFILERKVDVPPFLSLIPDAPYARGGLHFSNGPTWVEQLSLIDHALPSAGPALLAPRIFSNYAVGGARARLPGNADLSAQVNLFLKDFHGQGPRNALYIMWIGGDDLRDALTALATDPVNGQANAGLIVQNAIFGIRDNLVRLYGAGARRFLVPGAPDISKAPAVSLQGPVAQGAATLLASQFNAALETLLAGLEASLQVSIVRLDTFALVDEVVATPASFGLTDATDPCIALNTTVHPYCAKPGGYLFWDGIHPTVAGHRIVAERAYKALNPGPRP